MGSTYWTSASDLTVLSCRHRALWWLPIAVSRPDVVLVGRGTGSGGCVRAVGWRKMAHVERFLLPLDFEAITTLNGGCNLLSFSVYKMRMFLLYDEVVAVRGV